MSLRWIMCLYEERRDMNTHWRGPCENRGEIAVKLLYAKPARNQQKLGKRKEESSLEPSERRT